MTLILVSAAALAACSDDKAPAAKGPEASEGTIAVEIRANARVTLEEKADDVLAVTMTMDQAFDVVDPGAVFKADGRIERFPEAGMRMYTARFQPAARPGSPCGEGKAPTLALALNRRLENARVSGGLTVYCDARPVRILRLAGDLPLKTAP